MEWEGRTYLTRHDKWWLLKCIVDDIYGKLDQHQTNYRLSSVRNFEKLVASANRADNEVDKIRISRSAIEEWRTLDINNMPWPEKLREINQQIGLLDETIKHWSDNGEWKLIRGPGHLVIYSDTPTRDGNAMFDSEDSDSDSEDTGSHNPPSKPEQASKNPRVMLKTLLRKLQTL